MQDHLLLSIVVAASRDALSWIVESEPRPDGAALNISDIETSRRLVAALVDRGTDDHALEWTAEVLELTAKVMTHHRAAVPPASRQAWAEVGLLLRTAGLAFAETVGRVPGGAVELDGDFLDVAEVARRELSRIVEPESVDRMIGLLTAVEDELSVLLGGEPYPSTEAVARVANALLPEPELESGE